MQVKQDVTASGTWYGVEIDGKCVCICMYVCIYIYRGADNSLARPGRKQATATEDFEVHISYL
jgi:hypothetical protein